MNYLTIYANLGMAVLWAGVAACSDSESTTRNRPHANSGDSTAAGDTDVGGDGLAGDFDGAFADYDANPDNLALRGACPLDAKIGAFKVEMNEDVGYTAVDGVVKDGLVPGQVPEVAVVEGDCQLLRRRRLVCDPSCGSGFTCGFDETCVPMPVGQNQGHITLRGLVQPLGLDPIQPGNTYFYTRLPHPGFVVDNVIQLTSTPGYFGTLEMYGIGVTKLVPTESKWVVTEGEALAVHWTAPPAGARSTVYLEINVDQHGITPLTLTCELPDTGSAILPASVIDGLMGAGVTGYPVGRVTRRTMDSITHDDQCVEFMVSSVSSVAVEVTGHIPCARQEDCPSTMLCNTEIQQCY